MNYIVLDTETTNSIDQPIAYDIGWGVFSSTGELLKSESYAVAEIFLDPDLMAVAYFADKIPTYWQEIKEGGRKLARLSTIAKSFRADCSAYGITDIYAFNVRFDYLSTALTSRYLSGSRYRYFFPYGTQCKDILQYARAILKNDNDYTAFCKDNGYLDKYGHNRHTAEIVYRFWFDRDFNEVHQGIDDVMIESQILAKCFALDSSIDCRLFKD